MHNKSFTSKNQFFYVLMILRNNFFRNTFFFKIKNNNYQIFNFVDFYKSVLNIFFWGKIRVLYYVNNWIYTTNHKRIAVNYFWFVILSGIVGMVLATLIRLEFAYPGVGVFAGDSLQYLSMATAHGVIMVFFMIMPLLFGAFANFLIPTQLGVHDVAFPRLNSAAFWFLPGGLLMLCQLVCVDRRYQRMNCFNIREIQSILKRKFFTDLINTHDHHTLLDKTAMGLRFKTNNINSTNTNIFIFYNYGIEFSPKIRSNNYSLFASNDHNVLTLNNNSTFFFLINYFNFNNFFFFFNNFYFFFSSSLFFFSNFFINFKNFLNNVIFVFYYIYDYFYSSFFIFSDFLIGIFSVISNFFKNYNSLLDLFFNLPVWFSAYSISGFINFFYFNNSFFFNNFKIFLNTNINFSLNFAYFFNYFYDFFFLSRFLEIFYLYKTSSINFFFYFNYFYSLNYLLLFVDNLKNLISLNFFKTSSYNFDKIIDYKNSENNVENTFNNLKTSDSFFNNNFKLSLNYNSYYVYLYVFFYSILQLPFIFFNLFLNIFNFKNIFLSLSLIYEYIVSWYIPSLFSDNIFYFFLKKINSFQPLISFIDLNSLLNQFIYYISNFYFSYLFQINYLNLFIFKINYFYLIIFNFFYNILSFFKLLINSLIFVFFSNSTNVLFKFFYNFSFSFNNNIVKNTFNSTNEIEYNSNYFNNLSLNFNNTYANEELSNNSRYLKFYNPVFKYDYKSGDYFPKLYKEVYNYLFTTIGELTSSVRTAPWFLSDKYLEAFNINFLNFFTAFENTENFNNIKLHSWSNSRFNHTDSFYNFFLILSHDFNYTNKKWISLNSLNQKFYKMFNTSSMQQRIYSNWRQLKFTREAWRCKLLAARHQKTLFRRYVHEDGVFWSIERNAKDLLPGWAMITPFSSRTRFTAVGKTDIGLMGVFLVLNSSIISGANFLVTYRYLSTLNNRKMRDARVFFTESIIVACWMMIFANPMLAIAILMLLSDRHWQTSFFDYSGGGDTVLFQHMFWFFGHPEVYVIIIPTFGFVNSMISYYLRKRVSARASLLYSMYTIAFLGFFVWGHHMYMVGLAHTTRMLFSTLTVMISVPAATKIMHWCVTTVNSAIAMELPLLFTFTFIFLFVSGGISGMCVAHTGMDVLFHDTFYVIGHFHVMLAGAAMFSSFGAFYFYFPAIFGVKYSRIYAYLHYVYYLLGQLMTVIPMFWLGYAGMPRRVLDYPASMGGWHSVISAGHMLSVAGLMAFFIMIFDSLRQGRAVTRNTFGISRYNTRLNFYLYEISRLVYLQQKGFVFFRFIKPSSIKLNNFNYLNFEPFETTLITYVFIRK